jgi:putative transposase
VADVLIVVCDGLTGLPAAVEAVWPAAIVQTCIVHLTPRLAALGQRQGP